MNEYTAGATSVVEEVFIQDSASTTGAGKTGIVFNTASLTCYYKRSNGTASVAVTLVDITTLGTYVSGGFKAVDGTNMPGLYEFHPPDAAFATGAKSVTFYFVGASGMVARPMKFRILTVNPDSANAFMTGVNSLAPPTNWNLTSIDANGRMDVIKLAGTTQTARDIGASVNVGNINGISTSSVTTVAANQGTTQPLNFTGTGASALVKGDAIDWNSVAVTGMPMPTYTQPTGFLAATFPSGTIANTTNITAGTITTVANLTNAATSGDFTAAMKASITAAVPTAAQNATTAWANGTRTLTTLAGLTVDANMIKVLDDPSAASGLQAMGNMFDTSGAVPATDSSGNALATATALTAAANAILTEGGPGPWTGGGGGGSLTTTQNALIQSGTEK